MHRLIASIMNCAGAFMVLFLVGCSHASPSKEQRDAMSGFSIDQALRVPLERGKSGYETVVASLKSERLEQRHIASLKEKPEIRNAGQGIRTADGFVIESMDVADGGGAEIRISPTPCFPIERANLIANGREAPLLEEGGRSLRPFNADRNGLTVTYKTLGPEYRCVVSITMYLV